jgi:hypothetical protein
LPGIAVVIDPDDAALEFTADAKGIGFHVLAPLKASTPQSEKLMTSNVDSEGPISAGSKQDNIEISPKLRITGADEPDFRRRQAELEQKRHKLEGEGGVLRLIYPDGKWIDYWIRAVTGGERLIDNRFVHHCRTEDEITFVCGPFGKEEEEFVGEFSGSGRLLEVLVEDTPGSAEALARAEVVSTTGDIWELLWGKESRRLSEESTGAPYYPAGALTPLGGAAVTTATIEGKAGTSVVRQGTLTPNWTAQLATGHLTHQGVYEVYAWAHMPTSNTGEVGLMFEYGVGDLQDSSTLEPIYFPANHGREGRVIRITLGQVFIRAGARGSHRWEGRMLACSSVAGDDLDLLGLGLRPLAEGNSRMAVTPSLRPPAAVLTRDEFTTQPSGNLNAQPIAGALSYVGPKTPATVSSSGTGPAWATPENAKLSDASYATATVTRGSAGATWTSVLRAKKFAAGVPVGATITGIEVAIARAYTGDNLGHFCEAQLYKSGTPAGETNGVGGSWPSAWGSGAVLRLGGASDLWGTTWTPEQINAEGFEVGVTGLMKGIGTINFLVNQITVTIHYTDAAGQQWATTGAVTDFLVDGALDLVKRADLSNVDMTRFAIAGTTVTSDIVVGIKVKRSPIVPGAGERVRTGAIARYVDENNWLFFGVDTVATTAPAEESLRLFKRVGGGEPVELRKLSIPTQADAYRQVYLHVDSRGRYFAWGTLLESGVPRLLLVGQDQDLAAGGPLDDGRTGFYDNKLGLNACTRYFDQFVAWSPALDAVGYQNLPLELRHDGVERQSGDGGWGEIVPENDYLTLPPAGMENRKTRLVFIASPHDPDTMAVGVTPPGLQVRLWRTPRHRGVPDPV